MARLFGYFIGAGLFAFAAVSFVVALPIAAVAYVIDRLAFVIDIAFPAPRMPATSLEPIRYDGRLTGVDDYQARRDARTKRHGTAGGDLALHAWG